MSQADAAQPTDTARQSRCRPGKQMPQDARAPSSRRGGVSIRSLERSRAWREERHAHSRYRSRPRCSTRTQTHVWQPLSKRVGKLEMHPMHSALSTPASPSPSPSPTLVPPAALVARVLGDNGNPAAEDGRLLGAGNGGAAVGVGVGGGSVDAMRVLRPWTAGDAAMPRGAAVRGRQMDRQKRPMTPLVSSRMQAQGTMEEEHRIRPKTALARYRQVSVPSPSPASDAHCCCSNGRSSHRWSARFARAPCAARVLGP